MSIFEFVTVALSIVLGLGMAHLLTACVDLFRYRAQTRKHWVPIVWAVDLLCLLVVLWWQLFAVSQRLATWGFLEFSLAMFFVLSLFVASSLVLPNEWPSTGVDLWEYFRHSGRWGLVALGLFHVLAVPVNNLLFKIPIFSVETLFVVVLLVILAGVIMARSSRSAGLLTIGFLVVQLGDFVYVIFPVEG